MTKSPKPQTMNPPAHLSADDIQAYTVPVTHLRPLDSLEMTAVTKILGPECPYSIQVAYLAQGNFLMALVRVNQWLVTGVAKRNPTDSFRQTTGRMTAFSRALHNLLNGMMIHV